MRYYVTVIQYNVEKQAENRDLKAFDNRDDAMSYYHTTMGSSMKNATLSWALIFVTNSAGGVEVADKWVKEEAEA